MVLPILFFFSRQPFLHLLKQRIRDNLIPSQGNGTFRSEIEGSEGMYRGHKSFTVNSLTYDTNVVDLGRNPDFVSKEVYGNSRLPVVDVARDP